MYLVQHHASWTDTITGASFDDVSQVDQKLTLAAPGFPSRPRQSAKGQKTLVTDRVSQMLSPDSHIPCHFSFQIACNIFTSFLSLRSVCHFVICHIFPFK